jgi:hypothetical protein
LFNPLIGILASSGAVAAGGSYESIATVALTGNQATINFDLSSVSGYKHLQLRAMPRTNRGTYNSDPMNIRFNSDTGANYSMHRLIGDGSSAVADNSGASANYIQFYLNPSSVAGSNIFGGWVIDLVDYTSTSKNKTIRGLGGFDNNGSGWIALISGAWYNSSTAITSVQLTSATSNNFVQYSHFALYGIKD